MEKKQGRNWRDFLKEYAIIVIGVLTALAAQQAVEWWHWRVEVREAKEIIASEMARNIAYGTERIRAARCIQSRQLAIADILDAAAKAGALPSLGDVGGAVLRPWSSGAWNSVVASQAATHFSRQELAALSLAYKQVERIENWNRQETEAWSNLQTLSGAGRRYDPAHDAELRKALGLVITYNTVISITSERFILSVQSQNLPFTQQERQQMAEALKTPDFSRFCAPVSATSKTGTRNAMSEPIFRRFDALQKRLVGGEP